MAAREAKRDPGLPRLGAILTPLSRGGVFVARRGSLCTRAQYKQPPSPEELFAKNTAEEWWRISARESPAPGHSRRSFVKIDISREGGREIVRESVRFVGVEKAM